MGSSAIRMAPLTELQVEPGRQVVGHADGERARGRTEVHRPVVDGTVMSPEPELACRPAPRSDRTMMSPEPDLAATGSWPRRR